MNCINCKDRICRTLQGSCGNDVFIKSELIAQYHNSTNQDIIKAAAELVQDGKAGSPSRLEEIIEYAKTMKYIKLGLAYCDGMEKTAKNFQIILTDNSFDVKTVSCTVGGLKQSEIKLSHCIEKVTCNPLGQAYQLNEEKVNLTIIVGICLGHDIILHRNLNMDFTTLVVKDRQKNKIN